MVFEMSDKTQVVTVYHISDDTGELVGVEELSIPPHTGLPACSTQSSPPEIVPGETAVFNAAAGQWSLIEDHRGQIVYSTASGEPVEISALGELPEGVTTKAPADSYQKWDGANWVNDTEAKHQAEVVSATELLTELMRKANEKIAPLSDAVELGIQTDDEVAQLTEWKKYRVALSRIDTSTAPDIAWPEIPA
ncbi:tail fiber assembly protein [Klebsiella sp. WOUb02]|uniref:tail fiber assembly protein n=1 Tax=Klebsiella sp. WOUb02 TaxID=3161071 RepID=UPI003CE7955F